MKTYNLLIIWRTGEEHTVLDVSEYGYDRETKVFYFCKNGIKSFIQPDAVSFVGNQFGYQNK